MAGLVKFLEVEGNGDAFIVLKVCKNIGIRLIAWNESNLGYVGSHRFHWCIHS